MTPTFGRGRYREDSLGEAFCRFIESKVLPGFRPEESHPYDPIFRLLILLLPIGATPVLNSPAFATFERLSEAHPSYAIELLRDEIKRGLAWPRPFIWRLLSIAAPGASRDEFLLGMARADTEDRPAGSPIRREAAWFLTQTDEVESDG